MEMLMQQLFGSLQRSVVTAVVVAVFFAAGSGAYQLLARQNTDAVEFLADQPAPRISSFDEVTTLSDVESFNILLLGFGGPGHQGGFLTDVIMLVHVNLQDNILGLISIPRDLWVTLPNSRQSKINAAFAAEDTPEYPTEDISLAQALEGATKTKSVIETVTGLTPNFFVGIDFNSFVALIDQLGGITVDVPQSFEDAWYPVKGRELELCGLGPQEIVDIHEKYSGFELEKQFPCRYETLSFTAGPTAMDGETALKFVRSRHSPTHGGDFARSARQQAVLLGLRDALLSRKALENPGKIYQSLSTLVQTNVTRSLAKNIAAAIADYNEFRVVSINLTTDNVLQDRVAASGAAILTPKSGNGFSAIHEYIAAQLHAP